MFKVTPNPPDTDPVSPYEPDSNKLNTAAERALDFHFPSTADIKATPRTPSTLFTVDPQATTETLVVYLVETLASVDVMVPSPGGSPGRWFAQRPAGHFQQHHAGGNHGEPGAGSDRSARLRPTSQRCRLCSGPFFWGPHFSRWSFQSSEITPTFIQGSKAGSSQSDLMLDPQEFTKRKYDAIVQPHDCLMSLIQSARPNGNDPNA
ncbi:hypothetical protein PS639_05841 [Pseudomonas fluorescens]|nr:hypothetical protein PS639_05841 [Pseudomonas fluorescens]